MRPSQHDRARGPRGPILDHQEQRCPTPSNVAKSLRERFGGTTEERLGRALSDLLENPLLTGAIGRAFDAREKAVQAQEVAMGALNIPSAADIERLTRRLRSVSHRLEGIEDGVHRLDRALPPSGWRASIEIGRAPVGDRGAAGGGSPTRLDRAAGARQGARQREQAAAKARPSRKAKAAARETAKARAKAKPPAQSPAPNRAKPER